MKFTTITKRKLTNFENELKKDVDPEDIMCGKETVVLNCPDLPDDLCGTDFTVVMTYSDKDVFNKIDKNEVHAVVQFFSEMDPTYFGCWYSAKKPEDPEQFIAGLLEAMKKSGKDTANYYKANSFENYL